MLSAALLLLAATSSDAKATLADVAAIQRALVDKAGWTARDTAVAKRLSEFRMDLWVSCTNRERDALLRSRETPADIATAVLSSCVTEEVDAQVALGLSFRDILPPGTLQLEAAKFMAELREETRSDVIAKVVKTRAH